jgi:hypothetical protein
MLATRPTVAKTSTPSFVKFHVTVSPIGYFVQRFAASSTVSSSLSSEPSGAVLATILKRLHNECRSLDSFDECAPVALAQGCC